MIKDPSELHLHHQLGRPPASLKIPRNLRHQTPTPTSKVSGQTDIPGKTKTQNKRGLSSNRQSKPAVGESLRFRL
jgi:hypothetical protein